MAHHNFERGNKKPWFNDNEAKQDNFEVKTEEVVNKETNNQVNTVVKEETETSQKVQVEKVIDNTSWKYGNVFNCSRLNFRTKPDKLSEIIGVFNNNELIQFAETEHQEWYKIKDNNGKIGYCMSEFIKPEV